LRHGVVYNWAPVAIDEQGSFNSFLEKAKMDKYATMYDLS